MRPFDREYVELLREMATTEFKRKDQASYFGLLWSLLHPLLMLTVLFIFFRLRFAEQVDHYAIYMLIGIVQYTHFSNTTSNSISLLQSMKRLTVDAIFPKEVLIIGSVLARSFELALGLVFCAGVAWWSGIAPGLSVLSLVVVFGLQMMMTLWVALLLSMSYVFVRDARHVYQVFLRLLFFATPIFYTREFLGEGLAQRLIDLNPLAALIASTRSALLDGAAPSATAVLVFLVINLALIFASLLLFRAAEPSFAEQL